jgi:PAS domain S-box-containing protein
MRVAALFATKKDFKKVVTALQNMGSFSGEIDNMTRDGRRFTALLSASLILNEEGKIRGSMGVSRDITEIKKAEKELKQSEERYRDLFDNANDFIMNVDGRGKFIYTNNAFRKALGYKASEMAKLTLPDLVKPSMLDKRKSLFNSFVGDLLEVSFIAKDGSEVIALGDASVRLLHKKPHSIRAIFRDVTTAREREREAREQRAKLESIFNSTENMMMWTVDRSLNITAFNANFLRYMGTVHKSRFKLGDNCKDLLLSVVNKNVYQNQLEAFKKAFEGKPQEFELPLVNIHGEDIWLQVFLNPVYLEDQLVEVSCLTYDVTDRIVIDRRIRDSLKEKEVLLSEVHHRVKNNLQVISSILNLQSSFVSDEKTLEILQESQNRIKSMSYIHETLYQTADFSSIGFTDYLNTLVRNLVQTYGLSSGNISLVTEFEEVVIPLDQAIPCGLIINELVSNAMKYAFEGIEDPELVVSVSDTDGKIEVTVKDNGIGLPKDFKYQEADSLGIQLVYTLAEQLDGEVEVESKSGTRFLLTFERTE